MFLNFFTKIDIFKIKAFLKIFMKISIFKNIYDNKCFKNIDKNKYF